MEENVIHNNLCRAIIVDMEFEAGNKKPCREEIFNIKSKAGQEAFLYETEINKELLSSFQNDLSLDIQAFKWKKTF